MKLRIKEKMIDCFLSLGSNLGNKWMNINNAIKNIESSPDVVLLLKSNIYKTQPLYNSNLNDFYNSVLKIKTNLSPLELLGFIKNIEKKMGRVKTSERYSDRPIDIDILSYGDKVINSKKLIIPHPQIKERKFVLKPWSDIDSCYILATSNKKISELLNETLDNSELLIIKK